MAGQTKEDHSPTQTMLSAFQDMQKAGLGPAAWMGTTWMQHMSSLGSEWLTFVSERIQEDVKTQHALLHCKDLATAQHVQMQFLQKAIDDYQAETGKIVEMNTQIMDDLRASWQADPAGKTS
ncbi:phasin family protein [Actibacterium sp. 188UL27-1]|uniref:phasin family protein n=1 Tax=Actibacterium sp. 188UL27-1 TaxID=2786961 RepID=UPI00195E61CB|nr:phasin family protein [Actibacterium sp. 188UL27-1]MBM7066457.1 phasin family protein [Actibacterium sp. 188UL27-1]